ncbi:uncharacterized protein CCOS01_02277 [Colletotrichum costaricense]|uniref:Uncharacterized protein n=1 Tax=Colletotrichum costaricense TaxID=1209916 RepID=A0AAI9Z968_9PEZI|nr:uncharacterized protein CCOS01_02277 [Colletotrichum costaricense]KAK1536957.1 hypothetical protein CCOS01_02277 [Colletotrichum costaricense]
MGDVQRTLGGRVAARGLSFVSVTRQRPGRGANCDKTATTCVSPPGPKLECLEAQRGQVRGKGLGKQDNISSSALLTVRHRTTGATGGLRDGEASDTSHDTGDLFAPILSVKLPWVYESMIAATCLTGWRYETPEVKPAVGEYPYSVPLGKVGLGIAARPKWPRASDNTKYRERESPFPSSFPPIRDIIPSRYRRRYCVRHEVLPACCNDQSLRTCFLAALSRNLVSPPVPGRGPNSRSPIKPFPPRAVSLVPRADNVSTRIGTNLLGFPNFLPVLACSCHQVPPGLEATPQSRKYVPLYVPELSTLR